MSLMLRALITVVCLVLLPTPAAAACTVSWVLCPNTGTAPATGSELVIQAGGYGTFHVNPRPDAKPCDPPIAAGSEELKFYPTPPPGPAPPCCEGGGEVGGPGPPGEPGGAFAGVGGEGEMCLEEELCSTPPDGIKAPWIAVLDWPANWHGAAVAATVKAASSPWVRPVLFSVETALAGCPATHDVSVLVALAEVSQRVFEGTPAPEVINMSFGRLLEADDAVSAKCDETVLSCQISRLLEHVVRPDPDQPPRSVAVAAGGNYARAMFPAAIEHVVAAGSLDVTLFTTHLKVAHSWEAPDYPAGPEVLVPGSGLCLRGIGSHSGLEWPAPAGSSFAAAIFSGTVAELLLHRRDEVLKHLATPPDWRLTRVCKTPDCLVFTHGGTEFPTPSGRSSQLLHDVLFGDPALCGAGLGVELAATFAPLPSGSAPLPRSLLELVAETHEPAPGPDLCVPCSMPCEIHVQSPLKSASTQATAGVAVTIDVDLHAGWQLPPGMQLKRMLLRIGSHYYDVDLAPGDRARIARGKVGILKLSGTVHDAQPITQPSLVSLLQVPGAGADFIWKSTPLILQYP